MKKKELIKKVERLYEIVGDFKGRLEDIVFCEDCGVALQVDKAFVVECINYIRSINFFYCQKHKKLYEKEEHFDDKARYYMSPTRLEVDKHGKELKKSKK